MSGSQNKPPALPGVLDILAVETKAKRGQLSPEQREFLETVRGLGGLAVVVKSWKELDLTLRREGYAAEDMTLFEAPEVRGLEEA